MRHQSQVALSTYLAKDYESLLTTDPVLEEVKKELNLEQSTSAIASMISVELEEDTRIIALNNPRRSISISFLMFSLSIVISISFPIISIVLIIFFSGYQLITISNNHHYIFFLKI